MVTSVGGTSSESRAELSERFGTGGVGHGVRQRLLRVAAVVVNLEQDGDVHKDLQQPAGPELHGGLGEQEVDGFKGVAAGPHQHHLDAGGDEKSRELKIDAFLNQLRHQNTVKHFNEDFSQDNRAGIHFKSIITWFRHDRTDSFCQRRTHRIRQEITFPTITSIMGASGNPSS